MKVPYRIQRMDDAGGGGELIGDPKVAGVGDGTSRTALGPGRNLADIGAIS
jgi:hypothetical protein